MTISNTTIQNISKLKSALNNFKKAHQTLLNAWNVGEKSDESNVIGLYPFKKPLNEYQVADWVDASVEELEKLHSETQETIPTITIKENLNLTEALQQYKEAYSSLLHAWSEEEVLNDLEAISLYPFESSFDELNIHEWVEESLPELS